LSWDANSKAATRSNLDRAPQERLGQNIKTRREVDDLTQEDLAAACDLHPTEIGRIERGERDIRLSTVVRVARGLHVAPSELLEGID
jgi:transcriptional regulator with XRE-family HTH domain